MISRAVRGLEDLWDLMTQTAGRRTNEAKVLSPPCPTWEFVQYTHYIQASKSLHVDCSMPLTKFSHVSKYGIIGTHWSHCIIIHNGILYII